MTTAIRQRIENRYYTPEDIETVSKMVYNEHMVTSVNGKTWEQLSASKDEYEMQDAELMRTIVAASLKYIKG